MQSRFTAFVHIKISCGVVLTAEDLYIYPATVGMEVNSNRRRSKQ